MYRQLFAGLACAALVELSLTAVAPTMATAAHRAGKAAVAPVEQALRKAHKLLCEADRDYDGHRAKAAEEVHHAMLELGYHHRHKVLVGRPLPAGEKAIHEFQQKSDTQLTRAKQILQEALGQLSGHPKAAAKINTAIGEISTALAIK